MEQNTLKKNLDYFIENQTNLVEKYLGKILVIYKQKVVGAYRSPIEAYTKAKSQYKLGTFSIQECIPGSDAYATTIYSSLFN